MSVVAGAGTALPLAATEGKQVPFIRLDSAHPELFAELMETVERIAGESAFTLGPELERFEDAFAEFCGTKYAIGVSSGTAALELALRGLGIGPGDEVIVPTYSFIATAEAVSTVGATPVIVDVDEETALITAEIVAAALTPRTRCVIPVHLFGRTVEMDPLLELCRARDIAVVEDACQAHGALYRGRPVGSLGDAGCFSFYPTKNMTTGEGGMITTADGELAERLRLLREHGMKVRYHHDTLGYNFRMTDIHASIGLAQLTKLPGYNERRRAIAARYDADLRGVITPYVAPGHVHVYHQYTIRVAQRDAFADRLRERGVGSGIYYPIPVHHQKPFVALGYGDQRFPITDRLTEQVLSIPVHPSLTDAEVDTVVEAVNATADELGHLAVEVPT